MNYKGRPILKVKKAPPIARYVTQTKHILRSILDVCYLLLNKKRIFGQKTIVFTAPNFFHDGSDRLASPLLGNEIIYLNHSKVHGIKAGRGISIFNTGGLVFLLSKLFFRGLNPIMRIFLAYQWVNNLILQGIKNEVVTLCFYDMNGLSLIFSKHRGQFTLTEIQHGSIVNYPPYSFPAPVKIADRFYIKNQVTQNYLSNHLNLHYTVAYQLIPYPKVRRTLRKKLRILYASTVETGGFHPTFVSFLNHHHQLKFDLKVRLHPRERGQEHLFLNPAWELSIEFDNSTNWLENEPFSDTWVLSPWSSCIEDAVDNGFRVIILDPVGQQRFQHLIDNKTCFYCSTLSLEMFQFSPESQVDKL